MRDKISYDQKPIVSLDIDGNAFSVLGQVSQALKKAGFEDKVDEYMDEATSGDYDHLLQTSMNYVRFEE